MAHNASTALIHFYRGELGRMAIYRVRLDTTTNWAIGVSVAVTTFALGQPAAPHVILLLPYVLTGVFLFIESRRFQELEVFRGRIRAMEKNYFAPILRGSEPVGDWAAKVAESLESPKVELGLRAAMSNRIRRNYLWLFLAIYAAWWMKLWLLDPRIVPAAAVGGISGLAVLAIGTALLVPWAVLSLIRDPAYRA